MRITEVHSTFTRTITIGEFESLTATSTVEAALDEGDAAPDIKIQVDALARREVAEQLLMEIKAAMRRRSGWPEDAWKNKAASQGLLTAQMKALAAELK